ncbi:LOB domain-containing protein 4-like [Papaver somniferum]|uniref:LOB domain-containing protein 4-like n=1 Tax=Papaver somniferum TaxID=3469 RepID=UPI000E6FEEBF|nr:LOB domain-containing protein 4-like [Papaver somniferum]
MVQELPESQRVDAVSSMVYEANSRIRDPDIDDFMMINAITTRHQQQQQPTTNTIFPTSSSLSSLQQDIDDIMSNKIITQSSSPDNNFHGSIFGHANMGLEWNHPCGHN